MHQYVEFNLLQTVINMGQIRDQLQNLTAAQILPVQLSEAGGKVFVSQNARATQTDLANVVQFWRDVHAPTYGLPIPSSGTSATVVDTADTLVDVLAPGQNETAYITAFSLTNADPLNASTVTVKVGDATFAALDIGGNATKVIIGYGGASSIFLTKGQTLQIQQSGATTGQVSAIVSYSLSIQG